MTKEKEQNWYFTFGFGQKHEGRYCVINDTYSKARQKMFDEFGKEWAFQYSKDRWYNENGESQADEYNLKRINL